jgi:hypothetical protein
MAMQGYADEHGGHLPPAVVYGKDGRPLLSWRVLLLPYLNQKELYEEFRLDEPWDSPHNLGLLPRMPGDYAPPFWKRSRMPAYHTVCHVFVGKGAAFEGNGKPVSLSDFPDGSSLTLLIVEAGPPVPWTKPEELVFDPEGPLPVLDTLFADGFRAASPDLGRHFIKKGTDEATLRALITRNGDERLSTDGNGRFFIRE